MKILIAYQYLSFKGGIEHVIGVQAKLLQEEGHIINVLASEYLTNEPKQIADRIPVNRIKCINIFYTKFGIPFAIPYPTIKNFKTLWSLVDSADLVNVHGHPYIFTFVVTIFAKLKRKPILLMQHNTKIKAPNKVVGIIYKLADYSIGRFNISQANAVVAGSNETNNYVMSLVPGHSEKVVTIYNGIDSKLFKPFKDKQKLRSQLKLPSSKFICFTIRRITFKNGIDILLQAAEQSKNRDVLFLLGGSGPDFEAVKDHVSDKKLNNVKLLGFISDEDLPKYYAASDAFILPSRQGEGFPMVVLEAFASGLPVIATKSGGHAEIIEDSRNGFVVEPEKPALINEKVAELMKHDLNKMSKQCRELVLKEFTWQINIQNLLHVIEGLEVGAS